MDRLLQSPARAWRLLEFLLPREFVSLLSVNAGANGNLAALGWRVLMARDFAVAEQPPAQAEARVARAAYRRAARSHGLQLSFALDNMRPGLGDDLSATMRITNVTGRPLVVLLSPRFPVTSGGALRVIHRRRAQGGAGVRVVVDRPKFLYKRPLQKPAAAYLGDGESYECTMMLGVANVTARGRSLEWRFMGDRDLVYRLGDPETLRERPGWSMAGSLRSHEMCFELRQEPVAEELQASVTAQISSWLKPPPAEEGVLDGVPVWSGRAMSNTVRVVPCRR